MTVHWLHGMQMENWLLVGEHAPRRPLRPGSMAQPTPEHHDSSANDELCRCSARRVSKATWR